MVTESSNSKEKRTVMNYQTNGIILAGIRAKAPKGRLQLMNRRTGTR